MQDHDPSVDGVTANLARLKDQLEEARKLYDRGTNQDDRGIIQGRAGAYYALIYVIHFLCSSSVPVNLTAPLFNLATALLDLDRGVVNPILEKAITESGSASAGRPPDAMMDAMLKAWSAVALELCMRAGDKKEDAARRVHRAILHLPLTEGTSWKTICSWRDRIKRGDQTKNLQTRLYYGMLKSAKAADSSQEKVAQRFLRTLSELHPKDLREPPDN